MTDTQIQESLIQQQRDADEECAREHNWNLGSTTGGMLIVICEDCR